MNEVPPVLRQELPVPSDAKWPGWIAGTAIAYAVLSLVTSCCQGLGLFAARFVPMDGLEFPATPGVLKVMVVVDMLLSLVLAGMLLKGAVDLLRRRQSGIAGLRRYAVVRASLVLPLLVLAVAALPASTRYSADMASAVIAWKESKKLPVTEQEREQAQATSASTFQKAVSVAWPLAGGAYPLFLVLFLRRPEVRDVAGTWDA